MDTAGVGFYDDTGQKSVNTTTCSFVSVIELLAIVAVGVDVDDVGIRSGVATFSGVSITASLAIVVPISKRAAAFLSSTVIRYNRSEDGTRSTVG